MLFFLYLYLRYFSMDKEYLLPSRFKILKALGEGANGKVYKVFDSVKEKDLALKIIKNIDKSSSKTFTNEFKVLSNLSNPDLIKVCDFGFLGDENVPYFTMELSDGVNLKTFLSKKQNIQFISVITYKILKALNWLHNKQIIHGDIKPENINIIIEKGSNPSIKLLDFGLAAPFAKKRATVSGTPRFLAPEILAEKKYSQSSDLYALGMTIIECLTHNKIPLPYEIEESFYDNSYKIISRLLKSIGLKNSYSISSFIQDLCRIEIEDRIETSKIALKKFQVFYAEEKRYKERIFKGEVIGRESEVTRLNGFIKKRGSSGKTIILEGRKGVGKKSLINEIVNKSQVSGHFVLDLSSEFYVKDPFSKFIEILSANLTPKEKTDFIASHNKIQISISKRNKPEMLTRREDDSLIIFDNIIQFIDKISKTKPVLIIIPDIHRFGGDFLKFINHMVYEIDYLESNIRLIISRNVDTSLPKIKIEILKKMKSLHFVSTLKVNPLNRKQTKKLLINSLDDNVFNDDEIEELYKKTGGIPLFIIEVLEYLINMGIIEKSEVGWHLNKIEFKKFQMPEELDEIAAASYEDLNKIEYKILQAIAIYGIEIPINQLSMIINKNIESLANPIHVLCNKNILEIDDQKIRFISPIMADYVKKKLTYRRKVNLSNVIAKMLEKQNEDDITLAYHFINARNANKAFKYGIIASKTLLNKHRIYNSFELLNRLLKLVKKNGDINDLRAILALLAPVELQVGLINKSKNHYKDLIKLSNNPKEKGIYNLRLAHIFDKFLGNKEKPLRIYKEALKFAKLSSSKDLESEILIKMSELAEENRLQMISKAVNLSRNTNINNYAISLSKLVYVQQMAGKYEEISKYIKLLISLIDHIDDYAKKTVLTRLSAYFFFHGDYKLAESYIKALLKLEEKTNDEIGKITTLRTLGGIHYIQGNYTKTIEIQKKSLKIAGKYKKIISMITTYSNLSLAFIHLADYQVASEYLNYSKKLINAYNIKRQYSIFTGKLCLLYMRLGTKTEVEFYKYYILSKSNARIYKNTIRLGHTKLYKSEFFYQRLECSEAEKYAKKALGLFRKANDRDDIVDALIHIVMIGLEAGKIEEAAERVNEAREIFDAINCKYLQPRLLLAEGALGRLREDKNAHEILGKALKISRKMGTRETTWQIYRELALLYKDKGDINKALSNYRDSIETIRQITESIDGDELKTSYLSLPFRKRVFDEIKQLKKSLN